MRKRLENYFKKIGIDDTGSEMFSWLTVVIIFICFSCRVHLGVQDANNPAECKVHSINDILLSPAYALGCNLAKDRFDLKLN